MGQQARQKVVSQGREAQLAAGVVEEVLVAIDAAGRTPEREVGVAAVAGELGKGLGHKAGPQRLKPGTLPGHGASAVRRQVFSAQLVYILLRRGHCETRRP